MKHTLTSLIIALALTVSAQSTTVSGDVVDYDTTLKVMILQNAEGASNPTSYKHVAIGPKNWTKFGHIIREGDYISLTTMNDHTVRVGEMDYYIAWEIRKIVRPETIYSYRESNSIQNRVYRNQLTARELEKYGQQYKEYIRPETSPWATDIANDGTLIHIDTVDCIVKVWLKDSDSTQPDYIMTASRVDFDDPCHVYAYYPAPTDGYEDETPYEFLIALLCFSDCVAHFGAITCPECADPEAWIWPQPEEEQ